MKPHHPSRLALAAFDCFVADNEPLKGDLLEEFASRRSQSWLWRQVIGAVICQPGLRSLPRERTDMLVLGAAVLVLLTFEAVFVTNVLYHLVFGPPIENISAYLFLRPERSPTPSAVELMRTAIASMYAPLIASVVSMPIARLIRTFHEHHYAASRGIFALSVMVCTALSLELPFGIQFLTTLVFIVGLLASGCLVTATHGRPASLA